MSRRVIVIVICLIAALVTIRIWPSGTASNQSPLHAATVPELESIIVDNNAPLREQAIAEYAWRQPPPDTELLADLLQSDDSVNIRASAAAALGHMYAYDQVEPLLDALDDPALPVRQRAYEALSAIWVQHVSGYRGNAPRRERLKEIEVLREAWPHKKPFVIEFHTKQRSNRYIE